jgi:hypothetical protein
MAKNGDSRTPVFFDPSGLRGKILAFAGGMLLALSLVYAAALALSILVVFDHDNKSRILNPSTESVGGVRFTTTCEGDV